MSDMRCPFCQQELDYDDLLGSCINEHCEESFDMVGTESLWRKVINLKQEIDRTRKALDLAKERLKNTILDAGVLATPEYLASRAKETLDEITALEQKD